MQKNHFSWRIAKRYLWARSGEAFITLIGIISFLAVALSVAVLILVMSIMGGFESTLREKILGTNAHVVMRAFTERIITNKDLELILDNTIEIKNYSAFTYDQGLLRSGNQVSGVLVRGIEDNSQTYLNLRKFVEVYEGESREGSLFHDAVSETETSETSSVLPGIVLGRELARNLGLKQGDVVTMMSPDFQATPLGVSPRLKRFLVRGIYQSGLVEYESGLAYLSLKDAQSFFRYGEAVAGIEIRLHDAAKSPLVAKSLQEKVRSLHSGLFVSDWTESNRALWEALALEKRVYFLVLLLLIVLASFSIVSGLVMLVLEKRKDIAVLRTLGASGRQVAQIFVIQGALIGAAGITLGVLLGILGSVILDKYGFPLPEGIFPVDTVPVRLELFDVLLVAAVSFMICLLSTLYPARRAKSLHPAEVLRYE